METISYSPSTRGFYHGDAIKPSDAVVITEDRYQTMLHSISIGNSIEYTNGELVIVPTPFAPFL